MNPQTREQDELRALRALKQEIAKLPEDIAPERDLWHGIERRIAQPARKHSRLWELAVAASVAAVVSSAVVFSLREAPGPAPALAYEQLDQAYAPVRHLSLARYQAQAGELDPAVRATVEKNLAIIDQALRDIRAALKDRPNDTSLNQLLQRTYEQEMAILNAVSKPQKTQSI